MPCLNISTNVNLDGVNTSAILSEASSQVAKIIGKPESYVMIVLKGSVPISFGGTEQPAAYGELVSVGGLSSDVNKKLSAAIATILESKLSMDHCHAHVSSHCILPVCLGPSKPRICTVFACFTPELDHVNKSLLFLNSMFFLPLLMVLMLALFCRAPTLDGMVPPFNPSFVPELLSDLTPCFQTDVSLVFCCCRNLI
ncbi:unnamed protein product [Dovyalis caffra]|uniref:Macrophage migration inhibitory factor n=1 Tax=Dovyalis caffra TaxID=77055 RepID=A0AAV1S3M4_9ROSI|nr:unnamed protein product [Dovyalis caffra]